jgi:hypothetical protein
MKSILLVATCFTVLAMPTSAFAAGGGGKMMGAKAAGYDVNVACANWSHSAHHNWPGGNAHKKSSCAKRLAALTK